MKVIIVDDMPIAIKALKRIITELDSNNAIEIVDEITDANLVINSVKKHHPDLVFIDIDLGVKEDEKEKLNGLILADKIGELYPETMIVYATAHEKYALSAFEGKSIVLGYITKIFTKDKVFRVLNKINNYVINNKISIKDINNIHYIIEPKFIYKIQKEKRTKDVIIYYKDKNIIVNDSLQSFEEKLMKYPYLIKTHRENIVNIKYIREIKSFNDTSLLITFVNNESIDALITKTKAVELKLIS